MQAVSLLAALHHLLIFRKFSISLIEVQNSSSTSAGVGGGPALGGAGVGGGFGEGGGGGGIGDGGGGGGIGDGGGGGGIGDGGGGGGEGEGGGGGDGDAFVGARGQLAFSPPTQRPSSL
eukprot:3468506-Pleurochrysis_carterae.AAC.1